MAIVAVPRKGLTRFERLYFFEADDAEKQRTNVRKITVADGTDDVDKESSDADMADDDEDTADAEDADTEDDDEDVDLETDGSDMDDEDDDTEDTPDDTGDDDGGDDVDLEDDGKDMAGSGDDSGSEDTGSDDEGGGSEEDKTDIADATRRRAIFSRIHGLHDAIGTYVDKLTSLMTTASDNVAIYRKACDDLDELMTYTYDFMIVRFKNATYTESMLLYQRVLTAVSLVLDELSAGLDKIRKQQQEDSPEKQNSKSKKMDEELAYSSRIARAP